jgi:small-conductance mechanosensitive channel
VSRLLDLLGIEGNGSPAMEWSRDILGALLVFGLFYLLSRLVRYLLSSWVTRFTRFTSSDLDDRILRRVTHPLSLLVSMAGVYYALDSLTLPAKLHVVCVGAIFIANVAIVTNIAYRVVDVLLTWYASRFAEQERGGLDRQLIPLAEKLATIFLVVTAMIVVLKHFNYDILSLVTALGIGSLAIGLAAKDTLANMISGFTLMIDRPFRIGDRVQLSPSQWGDVMDIGLRSTKIKAPDNTLLIIPNATLCNSNLVNLAFPEPRVKGRIDLGVAYGSDVARVKGLLTELSLKEPEVLRDPPPEAFFVSFGDSALRLSLFFWVADYTDLFAVTDRINSLILTTFRREGIDIPFPITTVRIEKEP